MAEIGIIQEQGDLGLGFDVLNNKDQKVYNEAVNRQKNDTQIINEDKNNK